MLKILITDKLSDLGMDVFKREKEIQTELDFMSKIGNENRRGSLHYDSSVFPYIATAITKCKWNYNQYKVELDNLFEQYNINPFERGIL